MDFKSDFKKDIVFSLTTKKALFYINKHRNEDYAFLIGLLYLYIYNTNYIFIIYLFQEFIQHIKNVN